MINNKYRWPIVHYVSCAIMYMIIILVAIKVTLLIINDFSKIMIWLSKIDNLQYLYYIIGIFGIGSLIIAAFSYHFKIKTKKFDNTMSVIKVFQSRMIPKINLYNKILKRNKILEQNRYVNKSYKLYLTYCYFTHKHKPLSKRAYKKNYYNDVVKMNKRAINIQAQIDTYSENTGNIINNLEELSLYVEKRMILRGVLFREIGDTFSDFYKNFRVIAKLVPYYELFSCRKTEKLLEIYRFFFSIRNSVLNVLEKELEIVLNILMKRIKSLSIFKKFERWFK